MQLPVPALSLGAGPAVPPADPQRAMVGLAAPKPPLPAAAAAAAGARRKHPQRVLHRMSRAGAGALQRPAAPPTARLLTWTAGVTGPPCLEQRLGPSASSRRRSGSTQAALELSWLLNRQCGRRLHARSLQQRTMKMRTSGQRLQQAWLSSPCRVQARHGRRQDGRLTAHQLAAASMHQQTWPAVMRFRGQPWPRHPGLPLLQASRQPQSHCKSRAALTHVT